jgi:uncharacterized membrane protein YdbT with pleckstrin-like domain
MEARAQVSGTPGLPPGERVVARLRRHARVLALPALLLVAVAGATGYVVPVLDEGWPRLAAVVVAALVVLVGCVIPYLSWLAARTTITTRRVIVRRGLFVRVRRELWHRRGYDVQVRRGWLQRTAGTGDVRLETGHDVPVVLRDVPDPLAVQAALHELMASAHALRAPAVGPGTPPDGDTAPWARA